MSYNFSIRSRKNLEGVHPDLVSVVTRALELTEIDFTVVEGLRSMDKQLEYVRRGASKTLRSYHLKQTDGYGHAVDLYPYYDGSVQVNAPHAKFAAIAKAMRQVAKELGVRITWGADWDSDGITTDHSFVDSPHFQLEV